MDFARKQLEKYGWSEGKGLGKFEDGIVQALKPKPKHGSHGIGHDIADEFTNHWWQKLYNKAAENIEVKKKENGEVDSILTKNEGILEISTQKFVKEKKRKHISKARTQYSAHFTKRATLTNGTMEVTEELNVDCNSSTDDESQECNKLPKKLTDEELFAACGGRTAHKGARHGLQLNGKLARMQEHEENILKILKAKNKGLASTYEKHDSTYKDGGNLQKTKSKSKAEPSRHMILKQDSSEWVISEELPVDAEKQKPNPVKAKKYDFPATDAQPTEINAKKNKNKRKTKIFINN